MNQSQPPQSSVYAFGLFTFIVGGLLFTALLNRETGLTAVSLAVVGMMAACRLWAGRAVGCLSLDYACDRTRLFPGDAFTLNVKASNRGILPAWLQVAAPGELEGDAEANLDTALGPYGKAGLKWRLQAPGRGVYVIGSRQVWGGDLLGLFPRAVATGGGAEILVFPRLVPVPRLRPLSREMFGSPGGRHPVVDPVYILGTREYQPGRPARFIHWRASARHRCWQEKLFEPSSQAKVFITLETAGFVGAEAAPDFERLLEVVASLAVAMEQQGMQVGFMSNGASDSGDPSPPAWGAADILENLARLTPRPSAELAGLFGLWPGLLRGASVIHCSLTTDGDGLVPALCRRRGSPVTRLVCRPPDSGPVREMMCLHDLHGGVRP
ncbi:MAG: DUF58 domain-containing protein [Desulfarculaceae bacterium]|jgi:uncharacterized protein (DUF58 family)